GVDVGVDHVRHPRTSTAANGSASGAAACTGIILGRGALSRTAVTSTCGSIAARRLGAIMKTRVVTVWPPNRNVLTGADSGRSRSISARVPKNNAWLGQTVAHIGFLPTLDRS